MYWGWFKKVLDLAAYFCHVLMPGKIYFFVCFFRSKSVLADNIQAFPIKQKLNKKNI